MMNTSIGDPSAAFGHAPVNIGTSQIMKFFLLAPVLNRATGFRSSHSSIRTHKRGVAEGELDLDAPTIPPCTNANIDDIRTHPAMLEGELLALCGD